MYDAVHNTVHRIMRGPGKPPGNLSALPHARGLFDMFAIALHRTQYYLGLLQTWGKIPPAYTTHTFHPVRMNRPATTHEHPPVKPG